MVISTVKHSRLNPLARQYVNLALQLGNLKPGFVDAWYGPKYLASFSAAQAKDPSHNARTITDAASKLKNELQRTPGDAARREMLRRHYLYSNIRALETQARIVAGDKIPLETEMRDCYDVRPYWTPETDIQEMHDGFASVLGVKKENFIAAMEQYSDQTSIEPKLAVQLLNTVIFPRLRERTNQLFPQLPAHAAINLALAYNVSWSAYNYFKGNAVSGVKFNASTRMSAGTIAGTGAHEAWPGHGTDLAIHEELLLKGEGRLEHSISVYGSPWCVVGEGWANSALNAIFSEDEVVALQTQILRTANITAYSADQTIAIAAIAQRLRCVQGNVAIMLENGAPREQALQYAKKWRLINDANAERTVRFIEIYGKAYPFTYFLGQELVEKLLARPEGKHYWSTRILTEPVTPSLLRAWIAAGPNAQVSLAGNL